MAEERLSMIVFSGTVDKLMPMGILAAGAVAMGMDVEIFLTFWGLAALKKGAAANLPISADFAAMGPMLQEIMQVQKVPSFLDNLRDAKELGNVKIYACGMSMDLLGIKMADLDELVDDVAGVAHFIERAKEGKMTLFI